jgi:hypothetical protein
VTNALTNVQKASQQTAAGTRQVEAARPVSPCSQVF